MDIKIEVGGVVLAGGKSLRMGRPKAFLEFKKKPLIRHSLDLLATLCPEILIAAKEPELYAGLGAKAVKDIHPGAGPMAGVYAGLESSSCPWCIVLACDLPFVRRELLEGILERIQDDPARHAVIPLAPETPGGESLPQVLCAAYSKSCLPFLAKKIAEGKVSLKKEFVEPDACLVSWRELDPGDISAASFVNLNTPQEYEKWRPAFLE